MLILHIVLGISSISDTLEFYPGSKDLVTTILDLSQVTVPEE